MPPQLDFDLRDRKHWAVIHNLRIRRAWCQESSGFDSAFADNFADATARPSASSASHGRPSARD